MQFDHKTIMKMAGYGKLMESGDYTINAGPVATGIDHNQTNQMGDNPMLVPEDTIAPGMPEVTDEMLERMHAILTRAGFEDSDIAIGGCKVKDASCPKIAKMLTGSDQADPVPFVKAVIEKLSEKVMGAVEPAMTEDTLEEFAADDAAPSTRFVHTVDTLGNVTIKDSRTGKEVFLQGEDAMELLGELEMNGKSASMIQNILSQYQHVMEGDLNEEGEIEDFNAAFKADSVYELKSLEADITSMRTKLQAMIDKAQQSGDVTGAFAAGVFQDEVSKLENNLKDYLSKQ